MWYFALRSESWKTWKMHSNLAIAIVIPTVKCTCSYDFKILNYELLTGFWLHSGIWPHPTPGEQSDPDTGQVWGNSFFFRMKYLLKEQVSGVSLGLLLNHFGAFSAVYLTQTSIFPAIFDKLFTPGQGADLSWGPGLGTVTRQPRWMASWRTRRCTASSWPSTSLGAGTGSRWSASTRSASCRDPWTQTSSRREGIFLVIIGLLSNYIYSLSKQSHNFHFALLFNKNLLKTTIHSK